MQIYFCKPLSIVFKHQNERMVFNVCKYLKPNIFLFCPFLVVVDVITSREVQCHLHLNPQDPTLNSSDDFIARAVKR